MPLPPIPVTGFRTIRAKIVSRRFLFIIGGVIIGGVFGYYLATIDFSYYTLEFWILFTLKFWILYIGFLDQFALTFYVIKLQL